MQLRLQIVSSLVRLVKLVNGVIAFFAGLLKHLFHFVVPESQRAKLQVPVIEFKFGLTKISFELRNLFFTILVDFGEPEHLSLVHLELASSFLQVYHQFLRLLFEDSTLLFDFNEL